MGQFRCMECAQVIPSTSYDTESGLVLCPICDCGYDLASIDGEVTSENPETEKSAVWMPAYLRYEQGERVLHISEEKSRSVTYLMLSILVMTILALPLSFIYFAGVPLQETEPEGSVTIMLVAFYGFYGALFIVLTVVGLYRMLNHQTLTIEDDAFVLRNLPFNIPSARRFPYADIIDIYIKAHDMGVRAGLESPWEVKLKTKDNKVHQLIYKVDNRAQALWLVRHYRSFLMTQGE